MVMFVELSRVPGSLSQRNSTRWASGEVLSKMDGKKEVQGFGLTRKGTSYTVTFWLAH